MEHIVIQSSMDSIRQVEAYISNICDEYHVGNYFATISVAVLNAVSNAIIHGNKLDINKKVRLSCGHSHGGMFFEVEDQGDGFDYDCYGDFPMEGKGEGLFLMKSLADNVEFLNNGSLVRLEFQIDGISATDSLERRSVMDKFYAAKSVLA